MVRTLLGCVLLILVVSRPSQAETPAKLIAGKQVAADAKLKKGDRLVGVYERKNYLVEIREVKPNGKLRIVWIESNDFDDDTSPTELYYIGDATPTRKTQKSPLPESYQKLDKNKDGQIGLYEWERAKYAEFRKLDKNRDGFLTPQELASKTTSVAAVTGATAADSPKSNDSKEGSGTDELPNPGNLVDYDDKVNSTYVFRVTGKAVGGVWGTGPYAVESDLAAAAVHAGVLKDGVTGAIKVTIVESADQFGGSAMNGVTSVERMEAGPAFTIDAVKPEANKSE